MKAQLTPPTNDVRAMLNHHWQPIAADLGAGDSY